MKDNGDDMRTQLYVLKLNKYEYGVIFNVLNEKRNQLIAEAKDTEMIDNVLLKVIDVTEKYKGSERYGR